MKMQYILYIFIPLIFFGCLSHKDRAELFLSQGDFNRAIVQFNNALDEDPSDLSIREGLGRALIQKAIYLRENNADSARHWEAAVMELTIAQGQTPSKDGLQLMSYAKFIWAQKYAETGDTLMALRRLEDILEKDYRNLDARNYLAILHQRLGNIDNSIELLLQNTVLDSSDATARFNLGMLYWKKGDVFTAYDWWLAALRITPEDKELAYWMSQAEKKMEE